ncbi:tat pathway signal sequence [Cordyceps javanica]|uniref:Tat pathway signal sequence n=1 Tax=Cordyceps javanica TaxID=43265 RepID=A0A545WDM8_9HYPO|nr:tat pathway signal sequence [Cordyceps javanica]TQW12083.1 tat pathway signal sequence [Cordyceps javanica]
MVQFITAVEYQKQTIVHEVFEKSKFRGMPRPEVDEAWDDLLRYNDIRVQKADLEKANITSVPLNDEQGGYFVTLDVYHTLHCVNHVRMSYYSDYYRNPNPIAQQREHFDHCIDLLRQTLMCHGDISLHSFEWIDDYRFPWPTERTEHQCRNWDKLVAWSRAHSIPDLEGPILTHPTLGTSYRGNEPGWVTGAASGQR